jgi:hypothetical protein
MHQADALWVVVSLLAVWRVTHLLHAESGPWDVFGAVRRGASRIGAGAVFDCFYCLSLWVALPFAAVASDDWIRGTTLWFALSGGAILAHRLTSDRAQLDPVWRDAAWREATSDPSPTDVAPDRATKEFSS